MIRGGGKGRKFDPSDSASNKSGVSRFALFFLSKGEASGDGCSLT